MPISGFLPCISKLQKLCFGEVLAEKLQTDRTAVRMDAAGHGNARQAGERSRDRIKVRKVGGNRVGIRTKVISRTGGYRAGNGIDLTESLMEFAGDEAANLLSL